MRSDFIVQKLIIIIVLNQIHISLTVIRSVKSGKIFLSLIYVCVSIVEFVDLRREAVWFILVFQENIGIFREISLYVPTESEGEAVMYV